MQVLRDFAKRKFDVPSLCLFFAPDYTDAANFQLASAIVMGGLALYTFERTENVATKLAIMLPHGLKYKYSYQPTCIKAFLAAKMIIYQQDPSMLSRLMICFSHKRSETTDSVDPLIRKRPQCYRVKSRVNLFNRSYQSCHALVIVNPRSLITCAQVVCAAF